MRKIVKLIAVFATVGLSVTSCYNTRVLVGNVKPKDPVIKVQTEWNHHLLYGLVPLQNATMDAKEYVGGAKNYVVKTNMSFLNGLVSGLTFGLYTPTQTQYYVPVSEIKK